MISFLTFESIEKNIIKDINIDISNHFKENNIDEHIKQISINLYHIISERFSHSIIPSLFKNKSKCEEIYKAYTDSDIKLQRELNFE